MFSNHVYIYIYIYRHNYVFFIEVIYSKLNVVYQNSGIILTHIITGFTDIFFTCTLYVNSVGSHIVRT